MAKDLSITILMDFYGEMLTKKRFDVMDMYYNGDLSLAEIGEEVGVSRQGVRDAIKKGEQQLIEYEEKLGLAKRFLDISSYIKEANTIIDTIPESNEKNKLRAYRNGRVWKIPKEAVKQYILQQANLKK